MASKYRTRYKESGFKSRSFGDLGISSYKDQQDQIIDGLRIQRNQYAEVQTDALKATEDKARKEIEWDNYLKELEDSRYRIKRGAISKRQETEVEALKGKAAEYGRQSQFWASIAPKYSQSLLDISTGLAKKAEAKGELETARELRQSGIADRYIQGEDINEQWLISETAKDPTTTNLQDTIKLVSRKGGDLAVEDMMTGSSGKQAFDSWRNKNPEAKFGDWIKHNEDALRMLGINPKSRIGMSILDDVSRNDFQWNVQQKKERDFKKSDDDNKSIYNNYKSIFKNSRASNLAKENALHMGILSEGGRMERAEDGTITQRGFYQKDGTCPIKGRCLTFKEATQEFLYKVIDDLEVDDVYDWEDFRNKHNLKVLDNNKVNTNERIIDKLPIADQLELEKRYHNKRIAFVTNQKESDESKDLAKAAEYTNMLKDGTFDPFDMSPGGKRSLMFAALEKEPKGSKARRVLAQALYVDPDSVDDIYVLEGLERAKITNDIASFYNYLYQLKPEARENYTDDLKFFQEWDRTFGSDPKKIDEIVKGLLPDRKETLVTKFDTSYDDVVRLGKIRFMALFHSDKSEDFFERLDNTKKKLRDEIYATNDDDTVGIGIFRSKLSDDKKSRKYLAFEYEGKEELDNVKVLLDDIAETEEGATANFTSEGDDNFYKERKVVTQDQIDRALNNVTIGKAPVSNERIRAIVKARRKAGEEITVRKVWNEIFAAYEVDQFIPPGPEELNFWTMRNSKIMSSNYSQLSPTNQTSVAILGENYDGVSLPQSNNLNTPPSQDPKEAIREHKTKVDKNGQSAFDMSRFSDQIFRIIDRITK